MVEILFLTWSEYGQASVHLAAAFELYSRRLPGVNIHVASSRQLEERFNRAKAHVDGDSSDPARGSISFHNVLSKSYWEVASGGNEHHWTSMAHPPLQHLSTSSFPDFLRVMCAFSPDEYVRGVDDCAKLIQALSPDAVLVDMLFCQAVDACKLLRKRFITLSPLLGYDMASGNQSWYKRLFCYPVIGTDFSFPISDWKAMCINALTFVCLIYTVGTSSHLRALDVARRAHGYTWQSPMVSVTTISPDTPCICAGMPELDVPFFAPKGLTQVGPICLPSASLADQDPELKAWLDRGETVLMIMGSLTKYDEVRARDVLRGLLAGVGDRQVLWKVPSVDKLRGMFDEMLPAPRDRDRVRIVRWFDVEPSVIVEHENVICYIHHGGANSFLECVRSGTPQVVLPVWFDTYQNAIRAEYCRIGVYGNKTAAPGIDSAELGQAIWHVVSGPQSGEFRRRARELVPKCREAGGRERVADFILDYLGRNTHGVHM